MWSRLNDHDDRTKKDMSSEQYVILWEVRCRSGRQRNRKNTQYSPPANRTATHTRRTTQVTDFRLTPYEDRRTRGLRHRPGERTAV